MRRGHPGVQAASSISRADGFAERRVSETNQSPHQRTHIVGCRHVAITGLFSIGKAKSHSLCGEFGSQFWIEAWGYPPIGIYFADCPSAGHDMLCLDYRDCGPLGEPSVVHVDQEFDYKVTPVAEDFASFIRDLEADEAFDDQL